MHKRFFNNWRWVILYTALIYLSLPILPWVWNRSLNYFGKKLDFLPTILFFIACPIIFYYLIFQLKIKRVSSYISIGTVLALTFLLVISLKLTVERIHIFEYGILPFLIWRALKQGPSPRFISLKIFFIGSSIGIVDELIQIALPNRYYSTLDILINCASVILGLIICRIFESNKLRQQKLLV